MQRLIGFLFALALLPSIALANLQICPRMPVASAVSHQFLTAISASGATTLAQPAFTDISGSVAAAQMPALTGDITTSAGAVATTLATVNSNVGTFGDATHVAQVTVNAKGLVTAASSVATSAPAQVVQAKTGSYTILTTDSLVTCNTNACTFTMYAASAATQAVKICKIGTDTNLTTITRAGSDTITINGTNATSTFLHRAGECISLTSDGVSKFYISDAQDVRWENARIAGDGSCTITNQSGSWISSTSHTAAGNCTLTLRTSVCSTIPNCTMGPADSGAPFYIGAANPSSTTNITTSTVVASAVSTGSDRAFSLLCSCNR